MFMLLFETQRARCLLSLTHDLKLATFMPEIVKHQLGSCLSLRENPSCEADFNVFEVLARFDVLVFRYKTTNSFVMWGIDPMNVEMRVAVECAGSARSDLCILLHVKGEGLASFLAIDRTVISLRSASIQLPERQQTPSSPPGVGQLPLWRPSSPPAPSLLDVSSARFYYELVSRNSDR